ncbi:MAG: YlmC/YmxH family sporulation protein, partial [Bacillota bacterium]|nr:YlmC/YmxH family sporulation protein [Bacillota bacterium]
IELDLEQGRIESLLIPAGGGRMFRIFDKGEERVIHWRQIKKIGVDVILIDPDADFSMPFGRKEAPPPEQPLSPPQNPFVGDPFAEQEGIFEL